MKKKYGKLIRILAGIAFLCYLTGLIYFLFISEWLNRGEFKGSGNYNLYPFLEMKRSFYCLRHGDIHYFLLNFVANIAAFLPFGMIMPILYKTSRAWYCFLLESFVLVLLIEGTQYFAKVGIFDVDDLLLNVSGSMLGYVIFRIVWKLWRHSG